MYRLVPTLILLGAGAAALACSERQSESTVRGSRAAQAGMEQRSGAVGVARLPYARGQTFGTLDEYLAHLERQGAMDLPWWRQVEPGVYERVAGRMPGRQPERATRAELMHRFGFTR